jgi:hypothetical protein
LPLASWSFEIEAARLEAERLQSFLDANAWFDERSAVALMKDSPNLTALSGMLSGAPAIAEAFAYEFGISGVLAADLVLRRPRQAFVFIEFEGGLENSLFARPRRQLKRWSAKLDEALAQVLDWDWALGDASASRVLAANLGGPPTDVQYLIVCGRDASLVEAIDRDRLQKRRASVSIGGRPVATFTWDEFAIELQRMLAVFRVERGA